MITQKVYLFLENSDQSNNLNAGFVIRNICYFVIFSEKYLFQLIVPLNLILIVLVVLHSLGLTKLLSEGKFLYQLF